MAELVTILDGVTTDIFKEMVKSDQTSSAAIKQFLEESSSGTSLLFHCTSAGTANPTETPKASPGNNASKPDAATPDKAAPNVLAADGDDTTNNVEKPKRLVASINVVQQESESALEASCFYFLRVEGGEITHDSIGRCLEFGHITTGVNSLGRLRSLLSDVYVPLLNVGSELKARADPMAEFRSNMHKFCSQIDHALQQISGDVQLTIPNITIGDPESVTDDYEVVTVLEVALEDWSKLIVNVVEAEAPKLPKGEGPLAEIEFWRARNATLSALYGEQCVGVVLIRGGEGGGGSRRAGA
jgi:hypothetical protein